MMTQRSTLLGFVVVVALVLAGSWPAFADDTKRLRAEAQALVQAALEAETSEGAQALLVDAHSRLMKIQERYPTESVALTLDLGSGKVNLSPDDVQAMIVATPLKYVDAGRLRDLLGRELSPTAVDGQGWTDLHWAAALDLPDLAKALLEAGADADAPVRSDEVFLNEAAVELLTEHEFFERSPFWSLWGAPDSTDNWGSVTPLHIAAYAGSAAVASQLISAGADVDAKTESNHPPLFFAVLGVSGETAGVLLTAGANVDKVLGSTRAEPLHWVAFGNAVDAVEALIADGADVRAEAILDTTPLDWAAFGNATHALVALIAAGAEINEKPLYWAVAGNAADAAETLIANGADFRAKIDHEDTVLHIAAYRDARDAADVLIASGADVHAKNEDGNTPLHVAAGKNAIDVANVLIAAGANIHAIDNDGNTPLHRAGREHAEEVFEALVAAGADVDATNHDGDPPSRRDVRKEIE